MPSHTLNILNSTLASTLRRWRGTSSGRRPRPSGLPVKLFDRESSAECRLVREALTELNMDAVVYPCPENGTRHTVELERVSGGTEVPFLLDPNTETKLQGAENIIAYLFSEYRDRVPPAALQPTTLNLTTAALASRLRGRRGVGVTPSKPAAQPLTLYSFESSPYSRPVREKLSQLELPYLLINLSKQQLADMGPAVQRMHLGDYTPLPGSKREEFLKQHGNVQVPYLEDPNSGQALFESKKIMEYLEREYAA